MTPDDLKWREARREHIATALCAAIMAHDGGILSELTIEAAVCRADKLMEALDKRAQEERAANDAS
jgi:hypothetical protein